MSLTRISNKCKAVAGVRNIVVVGNCGIDIDGVVINGNRRIHVSVERDCKRKIGAAGVSFAGSHIVDTDHGSVVVNNGTQPLIVGQSHIQAVRDEVHEIHSKRLIKLYG